MYGDDFKWLFHLDVHFAYSGKDRWIGIRNIQDPSGIDQEWKNRKGKKQQYQLQLLPCLAMVFDIIRWTSTKPVKKLRVKQ